MSYGWLNVAKETKQGMNFPLTEKGKKRLDVDCDEMELMACFLEKKIGRYNTLCKQYEKSAGTKKGAKVLEQLDILKDEIDTSAKKLSKTLKDTAHLTHLDQ